MKDFLFSIEETTPFDAEHVASEMDACDIAECALFGHSPTQAIESGMRNDDFTYTAKADGVPMFIFGGWVTPLGTGRIWGLGSSSCRRFPKEMLSLGRDVASAFLSICGCWVAYSSADSGRNHRWMERIGFSVGDPFVCDGVRICRCVLGKEV